jgi:hypothetical protein
MTVTQTTLKDIDAFCSLIAPESAREIRDATGEEPQQVLPLWYGASAECYTAWFAEEPFALFGVSSGGRVWVQLTPAVKDCLRATLKASSTFIDRWLEAYPSLTVVCDVRNTLPMRWAHLLGFKPVGRETHGGLTFRVFQKAREE